MTQCDANGQDTDGRLHFVDIDPLPSFIHTCPECHFTASRQAFRVHLGAEEIFRIRAFLERQGPPHSPSDRYVLISKLQETYRRDSPIRAANGWLTAAWCSRIAGERRQELDCLRRALRWFDEELRLNLAPKEERVYLTYLIGELHRRAGNFDLAVAYFDAVPGLADVNHKDDRFLVTLTILQKHYARDRSSWNTVVPSAFINRGMFLRHFRQRLEKGNTRTEVSVV